MSDAYGQRLGERMRVDNAPAIVARVLRKTDLAVTEIRCDHPLPGMSGSLQWEDAFLVALQLRDFPGHEYWEDGRQAAVHDLRAGEICLYDLKRDPVVLLDKPYYCLYFYLPRAALNAIADDTNAPRIGDLSYKPGLGVDDVTIFSLRNTMLLALANPEQVSQLFVDHVMLAVGTHVAQTYGGMRPISPQVRGGLAPWQVRRAKEILSAHLDGSITLQEVARECHFSTSHFSRQFRRSTGLPPHKWLLARRIEVAKEKLGDRGLSLSDVAAACGFADQSHLTRVFTRMIGVSPGAWRRASESRRLWDASRPSVNARTGKPVGAMD
jgi:AraC family transcriptional regulator